ncbi:MAG: serine/threonine-protein kinase, partial [Phycisphaerae bacterium]
MKTYDADNSGLGSAERSEAILAARRQVEAASGRARQAEQMGRPVRVELPKTDSISGYKLLGEVHRGGQGVVYRALQESTRRQVALKVIHGGHLSGEVARLRFERETHILARLEHPNIVTIHDSGSAEGNAYYVMDFVDGSPLDGYVKRTPLSLDETLRLFATVCDAVHEAHVRGIIHRDLKPGNIMVDSRDQPRILDFGLAKLTGEDESSTTPPVTITGQFVGSMPWASPEQAQGRWDDIYVRSDVYSLGVVFYQILTGSFPYPVTGNVRDVVRNIVEVDPRPPGSIRRKFPDEVETILLKCLSKEPGRRYQSAGELARDLRNYLDGQPIDARRDSTWYVLKKTLRRHRVPVAFALLVALFGIAALGGLFVAHKRQTVLRAEAQRQAAIARAVNDFLNRDLLASVKPQEKGRDVTVREVLDEASQRIEKQFPDEPVIEAAVRETLGNTYMELGEWTTALIHAERALALTREQLGDRHRRTLSAMQLVGRLYRRLGRYEEAERALS